MNEPTRMELEDPIPFLSWVSAPSAPFRMDSVQVAQMWGLVGLATLARERREEPLPIDRVGSRQATRFAHAVGLNEAIAGSTTVRPGEQGRTVRMTCFARFEQIERVSSEISRLLVNSSEYEDSRRTIYYVMVELLRNAVQHSHDPLGGVVGAQLMSAGYASYTRDVIQVAVGDAGIGIPASLRGNYPEAEDPRVALDRCLWPHVSAAFEPGLSGNQSNAGMGLFFISEMAKLTAGRLLIATRGATLQLEGGEEARDPRVFRFVSAGFPGTLVAFELAVGEVQDYAALIHTITERARERSPQRAVHRWFRFESGPQGVRRIVVDIAAENTAEASKYARSTLEARILERQPIELDFVNQPICTQSFLHALLYEPLRLAWATRTPIYIVNAAPAVRSTLSLLESYALGG